MIKNIFFYKYYFSVHVVNLIRSLPTFSRMKKYYVKNKIYHEIMCMSKLCANYSKGEYLLHKNIWFYRENESFFRKDFYNKTYSKILLEHVKNF